MKRKSYTWLINRLFACGLLACGLLCAQITQAVSNKPPYNYEASVRLLVITEQGAYIHQRPHDNTYNGFMINFDIIHKYVYAMDQPMAPGQEHLPIDYKLLLINHDSSKMLWLGDHWIGDGDFFTVMNPTDYSRLTSSIKQRIKVSKPTDAKRIKGAEKYVHKLWQQDPEFYRQKFYFPDTMPVPHTTIKWAPSQQPDAMPQPIAIPTTDTAAPYSSTEALAPAPLQGTDASITPRDTAANNTEPNNTEQNNTAASNAAITTSRIVVTHNLTSQAPAKPIAPPAPHSANAEQPETAYKPWLYTWGFLLAAGIWALCRRHR